MSHRYLFISGILVVAAAGFVALSILRPLPPIAAPMPVPNGYDDIIKAAEAVIDREADVNALSDQALQDFVRKNAEAYKLLRQGLQRECRAPVEYSMEYTAKLMPELAGIKRLARLLQAEGRLAEQEERYGDAARGYLNILRLAVQSTRGGLLIHRLVSIACESIGMNALQRVVPKLNSAQCRLAIEELKQVEAALEPVAVTLNNEKEFCRRAFGWKGRLAGFVIEYTAPKSGSKTTTQNLTAKVQSMEAQRRGLLNDLAARATEMEKEAGR